MDMEGFLDYLKVRIDSVRKVKAESEARGDWREALFLETREDVLKEILETAEIYAGYERAAS